MSNAEEWAEQEIEKFTEKNKEELDKEFEHFILFGWSKIYIDKEGIVKVINEEDPT